MNMHMQMQIFQQIIERRAPTWTEWYQIAAHHPDNGLPGKPLTSPAATKPSMEHIRKTKFIFYVAISNKDRSLK